MNRKRINLRFHEICYGFCQQQPERIVNVTTTLNRVLRYHDNATGQDGVLYSLWIKETVPYKTV